MLTLRSFYSLDSVVPLFELTVRCGKGTRQQSKGQFPHGLMSNDINPTEEELVSFYTVKLYHSFPRVYHLAVRAAGLQ